jgi:hypothetical protein
LFERELRRSSPKERFMQSFKFCEKIHRAYWDGIPIAKGRSSTSIAQAKLKWASGAISKTGFTTKA